MPHARSATVSIASLLVMVVYPVSGSMCHVYSLPPKLTRRSEPRIRIGMCARTFSNFIFSWANYLIIVTDINSWPPQHLRTRETVCTNHQFTSSHHPHRSHTHMTDRRTTPFFLTDTPILSLCLSTIASRSATRTAPAERWPIAKMLKSRALASATTPARNPRQRP